MPKGVSASQRSLPVASGVEVSMMEVYKMGAQPMLAFYSPIPGTPDFEHARAITSVDEPLLQNNTVYLYRSGFDMDYYQHLKELELSFRTEAENDKAEMAIMRQRYDRIATRKSWKVSG